MNTLIFQNRRRRLEASRGFTLIEAVLALGISAVVLAAIGGVFYSALRLRDRSVAAVEEGSRLQPVLSILKRDLSGAMPPEGILASNFRCGSIDSVARQGVGIQFVTTTGPINDTSGGGDLQEVTFMLRETSKGRRGTMDLVRTANRNLLGSTLEAPEEELLLEGVEEFRVECFDGYEWRDTWDTTLMDTNLPVAVRVQLQVAAPDERRNARSYGSASDDPFEMIIPLTIQSRTNSLEAIAEEEE